MVFGQVPLDGLGLQAVEFNTLWPLGVWPDPGSQFVDAHEIPSTFFATKGEVAIDTFHWSPLFIVLGY
jgi:hypothetical protein